MGGNADRNKYVCDSFVQRPVHARRHFVRFFTRRGDGCGGRKHFAHIFGKFIVIYGLCHKVTCSEAQRFRNEAVGCKPRYHYCFRFFVKSGKRAQHAESVQFGHNDIEK